MSFTQSFDIPRSFKVLILLGAAGAALSACATKPTPPEPAAVASTPAPPTSPPYRAETPPPRTMETRPVGPLPGSTQDFVISAGDRVYFDYDQYAVRPDGRTVLDKQAAWLQRYPQVQVRIEGNADERGTREYNFALGARRAEAIKGYLEGRGVGAGRITTISYGKERPLDDGTGEDAYARNRNGHTAIVAGGAGQ
jgi:peptidoglycan-associated lipoprotein